MSDKKIDQSCESFDAIYELLSDIVDLKEADEIQPSSSQTIYRSSVVLWLLILQRQQGGCSMKDAVKQLTDLQPKVLPANKRLDEEKLSRSTAAYSAGRQRLSLETVMWLLNKVWKSFVDATDPTFDNKRVFVLDGTTLSLPPEPELRKAFPPATNQHGESPWPIAYLVVAHEAESGVALPPEVGPMYGKQAVSETRLISQHLANIPEGSVILADSAYGITNVAYAISQAKHQFILRLTKARFQRLRKKADGVEGDPTTSWEIDWTPSARELRNNPELPSGCSVPIRLHELASDHGNPIYLATNLPHTTDEIGRLYQRRWSIETDIGQLKIVLNTENIRAKSESMFRKELMTSVIAYNLTVEFRRQAAKRAKVEPRRLSFTGVWGTFRISLLNSNINTSKRWQEKFERALDEASKEKLPNRKRRPQPREAYKRRPKSTHFKKRIPPWKKT